MGDEMYIEQESLIVRLCGRRGVVSSSNLCGGYRQDLKYIFNYSCCRHPLVLAKKEENIKEKNLDEYFEDLALQLNLPPESTTGMSTSACIDNLAIATREKHGVTVMTMATAGIDVNGGRAGDKATYNEFTGKGIDPQAGTINILIFIDAKLNAGVLTRAIVTATEAKSAALQELMANSLFSEGIATGSGTDGIVIIGNDESDTPLYSSGKHVLLGEMIGESVKEAVTSALALQTGMTSERQASIEWQSKRYGITQENIYRHYVDYYGTPTNAKHLKAIISDIDRDPNLVAMVAVITHLCDQNRWSILSDTVLESSTQLIITQMLLNSDGNNIPNVICNTPRSTPAYCHVVQHLLTTLAFIAYSRLS